MSYALPVPQPPQTPSPLSDDIHPSPPYHEESIEPDLLDPNTLGKTNSGHSVKFSLSQPNDSTASFSTQASYPDTPDSTAMADERNPFDFTPTSYTALAPGSISAPTLDSLPPSAVKSNIGQRRGHRYKHSSISHNIFLEPKPRAPLRLPASLPIPTRQEGWRSMSREQTIRVVWCFCHLFVAGYVQWTAQGSLSLTALSHLIFYDAIGAFLCAGVEILSNFEVWKRSSIRQPFGLERTEVVIGFAMSILLLFMGFDLVSHSLGHFVANLGAEEGESHAHRPHNHTRVSPRAIDIVSVLAILSTLVSALMLRNHARMAKAMRFAKISWLPSVLQNPSHLLTISCSGFLLLLPLLSLEIYEEVDMALATCAAALMSLLGFQLVKTLGSMLLMSYAEREKGEISSVLRDIQLDECVKSVEEAKFWQVHYGLCMANIKLKVRGGEDAALRLRERVTSLVRNRLGGGYGSGSGVGGEGTKWEISCQLILEAD